MKKALLSKWKEALTAVLPVSVLVLVTALTPTVMLTGKEIGIFVLSSFFLVLGIGLFNLGADQSMTPMGEQMGEGLMKSRRRGLLFAVCFLMGLLVTVAEPDLAVLAKQVSSAINGYVLAAAISVGVGLFLMLAVMKTLSVSRAVGLAEVQEG